MSKLIPRLIFPAFKIGIFLENFFIKFSSFSVKPVVPITTFFFNFVAKFDFSLYLFFFRKYYKFSKKVKFSRSNVFLRDMFTCQYCKNVFEKKDLTIDHIIPKSKGGETNWLNVTTCCKSCNLSKADKIIDPSPEVKTPSLRDLIKGQESTGIKKIETDWQEYIVA